MGKLKKNNLGKDKSCSIDIDTFGRVRAVRSANGSDIQHIVKDSIEILQTPREKFSGIARVKLELIISEDQINLLNSNPL